MGNRSLALLSVLAVLFAACVASHGNAGTQEPIRQWKAIPLENSRERILYDPNSVVPAGPRVYRVWVLGFDAEHASRRTLEEYDCSNRIVREIEAFAERPGRPVSHTLVPSEWRDVAKESPRREILKALCR